MGRIMHRVMRQLDELNARHAGRGAAHHHIGRRQHRAGVTLHVAVDRGAQAFPADRVESGEIGKINLKSGSDADALNDRIARGASQHTGDAAGASEQRVEERALSRVGRAGKHDQRNGARVRRRLLAA